MDLSKPSDSLPHDILSAKIHAYGFEMSALKLIYLYLIDNTQNVKLKGEWSTECQIKTGVPQGSLLGVLFPRGRGGTCQNLDRDARPIFWV